MLAQHAASAADASIVISTIRAASLFAAGTAAAGTISATVVALTEEVVRAMSFNKLKSVGAVMLFLGLIATGITILLSDRTASGHDEKAPTAELVQSPANDAVKLFQRMERNIATAKMIRCNVEMQFATAEVVLKSKGTLKAADGNKAHLLATVERDGKNSVDFESTSDGKRIQIRNRQKDHETPKHYGEIIRLGFSRVGFVSLTGINAQPDARGADLFVVANFRMAKKEQLGDREAQAIEYTATSKLAREQRFTVILWLDSKTHLPLKRTLVEAGTGVTTTETYSEIAINGDVGNR
jgi:hypothetical protein